MVTRTPVVQVIDTCEMSKVFIAAVVGDVLLLRFRNNHSGEELKELLRRVMQFHQCGWIEFQDVSLAKMRLVLNDGEWFDLLEYRIQINVGFSAGTFIGATIGRNLLESVRKVEPSLG